jgi:hypothetical protein
MKSINKEEINKGSHTPHNFYWKYTIILAKRKIVFPLIGNIL